VGFGLLMTNVLVFGYGNLSRGDDALGPLLIEYIEKHVYFSGLEIITDFQLQIEHALDLEGRDLVLFVYAAVGCDQPYQFSRLAPEKVIAARTSLPDLNLTVPAHLNQYPTQSSAPEYSTENRVEAVYAQHPDKPIRPKWDSSHEWYNSVLFDKADHNPPQPTQITPGHAPPDPSLMLTCSVLYLD
jgi:hydrogenase maturation protease